MKNNKKGFTLVELVIVIAVIAILAGVLIGTFATVLSSANQSKALQEVKAQVDEAYLEYVAEEHDVPAYVKVNNGIVSFVKTFETGVFKYEEGNVLVKNDGSSFYVYIEITEVAGALNYSIKSSTTAQTWADEATNS